VARKHHHWMLQLGEKTIWILKINSLAMGITIVPCTKLFSIAK
jgi:hypothetical protein